MTIKLDQFNTEYLFAVDKLYRQFGGLASTLTGYSNATLHLKVEISSRWKKDPVTTAIQISKSWRRFFPDLASARRYRVELVVLSKDADTGGVISNNTKPKEVQALIDRLAAAMDASKNESSVLVLEGDIDE